MRISLSAKPKRSEVRNVEDLWEIFSKEDLESMKQGWKDAWAAVKTKYIYFLALVAIAPIILVVSAVFFHFQGGFDLPWVNVQYPETAAHWGQLGDFVGGILNPLLSFVAFIAVLINLVLQRQDLSLARDEAREANKTQKMQSRIFEKQNQAVERQSFETTFFRLLDMHSQQAKAASVTVINTGNIKVGVQCFDWVSSKFLPRATFGVEAVELVLQNKEYYSNEYSMGMLRYFRNLHQILKFIDGYGNTSGLREGALVGMRIRKAVRQYGDQRTYANMLRAQLSNDEQCCIFVNCLTEKGSGLKYYVEKYSLLKGVELPAPYRDDRVKNLYQSIAYADSEEITQAQIFDVISQKYAGATLHRSAGDTDFGDDSDHR
ncbi:putative phage abortive infection protein [Pseudomonas fluorescens]|uniref:putative phage abortive infection protein n=1 Tax=Pseudomonas fluorescens TaxID=294 RepID=UPI001CD73F01|nr:putative phage abortive infection protein [Pseudomonas fluorescens]